MRCVIVSLNQYDDDDDDDDDADDCRTGARMVRISFFVRSESLSMFV